MARPISLTKALTAADAQAVANSQALAAAGNLVINGTLVAGGVATLDSQRRILITSGGNDSGRMFTLYGANDAGVAITEAVTGSNGGTVASNQDFKTITRVAVDGAVATTVEVGTNTTGSTPWVVPNYNQQIQNIGVEGEIVSGAATYSIETTQNDVKMPIYIYQPGYSQAMPVPTPFDWPGLTNQNGPVQGNINSTVAGIRLTVTLGQGTVRATLLQSGIRD